MEFKITEVRLPKFRKQRCLNKFHALNIPQRGIMVNPSGVYELWGIKVILPEGTDKLTAAEPQLVDDNLIKISWLSMFFLLTSEPV